MISRRDKLLNQPWQQQRYEQHRVKVCSAKAAVDIRAPIKYEHVAVKSKKIQSEKERLDKIEVENMRLLQKLGAIMRTKRLENFWQQPRPNFLHREKLFDVPCRPRTSLPQLTSSHASSHAQPVDSGRNPKTYGSSRCPACNGTLEHKEVNIPEERIPWEPPHKSWNYKVRKYLKGQGCSCNGDSKEQ